jgi:hypothetical protein
MIELYILPRSAQYACAVVTQEDFAYHLIAKATSPPCSSCVVGLNRTGARVPRLKLQLLDHEGPSRRTPGCDNGILNSCCRDRGARLALDDATGFDKGIFNSCCRNVVASIDRYDLPSLRRQTNTQDAMFPIVTGPNADRRFACC